MAAVGLVPRLIGAQGLRAPDDFYPTPPEAVVELLQAERFHGDFLEPACGDGAISRILEATLGARVRSTDLVDRGYGESGLDFLMFGYPYRAANIVTNPPFRLAEAFVRAALPRAERKVCMLLKLAFLEGQERKALFVATPLARVWVFSKRLSFINATRARGGMMAFAWFVWDHAHPAHLPPMLGWVG